MFSVNWVILVVASNNAEIHSVLIHYDGIDLSNYVFIMRNFSNTHLGWIYNKEPFPESLFHHVGLIWKIYNLSVHIICLQFELWKLMMDLIHKKKKHIPKLLQIVPQSVAQRNTANLGIDPLSWYLSHVKIPIKALHLGNNTLL